MWSIVIGLCCGTHSPTLYPSPDALLAVYYCPIFVPFFTAFCDVFSGALNIIILLIHTAGWFISGGFGLVLVRPAHLAAQAASLSSLSSVGGNGVLV